MDTKCTDRKELERCMFAEARRLHRSLSEADRKGGFVLLRKMYLELSASRKHLQSLLPSAKQNLAASLNSATSSILIFSPVLKLSRHSSLLSTARISE